MQGEDAEDATELGMAEGGGFAVGEGTKFAGAAFDDVAWDLIG